MRYFLQLSYFGAAYHGWQKQPNAITVQAVLEDALSKLLGKPIAVVGAGRTDAGVHARQMYAHLEIDPGKDVENLVHRLNAFLPNDIAVQGLLPVRENAHARFDALTRTYEYWLIRHKDPFLRTMAHLVLQTLDVEAMNRAASILLVKKDFECFSKSNSDVKTFKCDVQMAEWVWQESVLVFTIRADRFLRNMVRAVVGTLIDIGLGKYTPESMHEIIDSRNRSKAGASVPAKGLYLTEVSYPPSLIKANG